MQIKEAQDPEELEEKLHFSPIKEKRPPIVVTEESDDEDSALSQQDGDRQAIYQHYFNSQLRRELKKAIFEGNERLAKNYLRSLHETKSLSVLNSQEKKNFGNTLLHIIILQV